jgi:oligoribonuclease
MIVNYDGENLASSSSGYKLPLVWIDLEMTGEPLLLYIVS